MERCFWLLDLPGVKPGVEFDSPWFEISGRIRSRTLNPELIIHSPRPNWSRIAVGQAPPGVPKATVSLYWFSGQILTSCDSPLKISGEELRRVFSQRVKSSREYRLVYGDIPLEDSQILSFKAGTQVSINVVRTGSKEDAREADLFKLWVQRLWERCEDVALTSDYWEALWIQQVKMADYLQQAIFEALKAKERRRLTKGDLPCPALRTVRPSSVPWPCPQKGKRSSKQPGESRRR